MMNNKTKKILAALTVAGLVGTSQAQAGGDFELGIGYMEQSKRGYGFAKLDGIIYEDQLFTHKLGLEYLGYQETLDSVLDTDITFSTVVINYELEYKLSANVGIFAGVGVGGQYASLDSPVGELDNNFYGYAQAFAGFRASLTRNLDVRLGVRRMFFDEYDLLGVSNIKQEQTWGFDLGLTLRF